jgi:hypothetical protein
MPRATEGKEDGPCQGRWDELRLWDFYVKCKKSFTCIVFVWNDSCSGIFASSNSWSRLNNPGSASFSMHAREVSREIRTLDAMSLIYPAIFCELLGIPAGISREQKKGISPLIATIWRAALVNHLTASELSPQNQTTRIGLDRPHARWRPKHCAIRTVRI